MRRVKDIDSPYLKALFYGQAGSTKTRTMGTAAFDERTAPVLWLDMGGNPFSIRDYEKKPDILALESLEELNPIYEWLVAGQPDSKVVEELELSPPYKTIVIDGVTEVQRRAFARATGAAQDKPGDEVPSSTRQHFGRVLGYMVNFARLFYSLDMHVMISSLEREDKDEMTGAISYKPLLWGQSSGEVAGYAFLVARLLHRTRVEKKILRAAEDTITADSTSVALFQPSGKYIAKDQYGKLPPFMADPTIPRIMDLIYGEA